MLTWDRTDYLTESFDNLPARLNGLKRDPVVKRRLEASSRTQLVVTTHSDMLVDALSDTPRWTDAADRRLRRSFAKRFLDVLRGR